MREGLKLAVHCACERNAFGTIKKLCADHQFAEQRRCHGLISRVDELEAALRDCIPFLAVNMEKYRRDLGVKELHPTHAEIIDRVSALVGGEKLSVKLAE